MCKQTMESVLRGMALKEFATDLCNKLLEAGFVIYRYDAYSTNSVYLKLDFGVCNSIRISDHAGKGYLKYRYNIGTNITEVCTKQDKFPRHYYPTDKVDVMLSKIIADRNEKLRKYGKQRYNQYMEENKKKQGNEAGFWSKSYRVL